MKPFHLRVCMTQAILWSESVFVFYTETAFWRQSIDDIQLCLPVPWTKLL